MREEVWFEPMAVVLGKGIVKSASWGLMARVIVGAVLSVTDLATDLFVLYQFWEGGDETLTFRNAQLISLAASFTIQLIVVAYQNHKMGLARILKEMLIVVTGLKAPYDALPRGDGRRPREGCNYGSHDGDVVQ
ncbi:hypothetical protein TL16_g13041 [Triparma laevis f. inornata]|uniref:Uncharacterized protein n=1 Tax=Triparma laevis f. inornata TaxID=1714386 RepID=A0A9W7BQL2_9STRA|nr:hypothetical protein TL16_g13041 [Triparma laevis f. inornata]